MYSEYDVDALAYGVDGDLDTFDIDFVNGIEASEGIDIRSFRPLSFVDDDMSLLDESGFDEFQAVFLDYTYLLLQEVFEAFSESEIFKKISRKPTFFLAIQEHDLDEQKLFYVFENETVFIDFLEKEAAKKLAEEAEKQEITYHYDLRWHLDGLIDDLLIENDTSKIEEILSGLNELITQSDMRKHWAERNLGNLYLFGKGVEQDFTRGRLLLENVIEHGHRYDKQQAYTSLAVVYFSGNGVEKDIPKALECLKIAHEIEELFEPYLKLKEHIETMLSKE